MNRRVKITFDVDTKDDKLFAVRQTKPFDHFKALMDTYIHPRISKDRSQDLSRLSMV